MPVNLYLVKTASTLSVLVGIGLDKASLSCSTETSPPDSAELMQWRCGFQCRVKPGLVLPSEESKRLVMDRCSPEMLQETLRRRGHDLTFRESAQRQFAAAS
jgi:hypothetical protein